MCQHEDDHGTHEDHHGPHEHDHGDHEAPRATRRRLLQGAALAVPAAAAGSLSRPAPAVAAAAPIPGAYSMAMHLHTSFSEGYGSMNAHLDQATANGVDVVWWTDHDNNLSANANKKVVHFTSLTAEQGDGVPWEWRRTVLGSLTAASGGGIVDAPASPRDTVAAGSLRVAAQSTGPALASFGFAASQIPSRRTWRANLASQTVSLEALPTSVGADAYLEIRIVSSYHPARGGRTAGQYTICYRLGGSGTPGTRRSADRVGTVYLPVAPRQWNSLRLRPDQDLAALFPDLDSRDFSLHDLRLFAVSKGGARCEGYFDYLRFTRPTAGETAVTVQHDMMADYAHRYPQVAQRPGVELSHYRPHINWYGGDVSLPAYPGITTGNYFDYVRQTMVPDIHAAGGLASYNHPYGVSIGAMLSKATQDDLLRRTATTLLPVKACGTDIMEVGYPSRGGVDLTHHIGLWDVMSRNAVFLTGNGVSDDHAGVDWKHSSGDATWLTYAWAPDNTERSLLKAMRAGRSWCAGLNDYRGALDLEVDGTCPMGSVSVSGRTSRSLAVRASQLPAGATVQVVQGQVDYAGTRDPAPSVRVVATLSRADLSAAGRAMLTADTSGSSFVRTQVRNAAGRVVATSNPVWLLRQTPAGGIPAARAV